MKNVLALEDANRKKQGKKQSYIRVDLWG